MQIIFQKKSSYVLTKYFDFVNQNLVTFNDAELLYSITNSNTLELLKGRHWRGGGAIALILAVTHEG